MHISQATQYPTLLLRLIIETTLGAMVSLLSDFQARLRSSGGWIERNILNSRKVNCSAKVEAEISNKLRCFSALSTSRSSLAFFGSRKLAN
jgi:hypothetical protein